MSMKIINHKFVSSAGNGALAGAFYYNNNNDLVFQDNVDWRTDFLIQHYGEGEIKIPGCPQLSSGVFVSDNFFNLLFFFRKKKYGFPLSKCSLRLSLQLTIRCS